MMGESKRKFENPTQGWVGAVVLDDDNKPKGMPVEPGGSIWLSTAEERLTAEAPRMAEDNPFTKSWKEVTEWDGEGKPKTFIEHTGVLRLSEEPAREILSDRFIPSEARAQAEAEPEPGEQDAGAGQGDQGEEITGAPPIPTQPPLEGKPAPDEIVGTPEAVAKNDEYLARVAAEEAAGDESSSIDPVDPDVAEAPDADQREGERTADEVASDGPKGPEEIGVQKKAALV